MDTSIWGTLLWNVLDELARLVSKDVRRTVPTHKRSVREAPIGLTRQETRDLFILLLYSLRYTLPCVYCRESFRTFIADSPPGDAPDLLEWIWHIHDKVNRKLCVVPPISYEKFTKRARLWSTFVSPTQVWDVVTIIAHNYPRLPSAQEDAEFGRKRYAYWVFFYALSRLAAETPFLVPLSSYLSPYGGTRWKTSDAHAYGKKRPCIPVIEAWSSASTSDRDAFVSLIRSRKRSWATDCGISAEQWEAIEDAERALLASLT